MGQGRQLGRRQPVPRGPGDGYPRNIDLIPLLEAAIESHKEMADFGGKLGIKVTIENHWGLAADPMNIRTIIDEVNHPYCEASPDFGNWEHEYNLVNGLKALAPYASSNVHAKFWDRWGDRNNVQRSVRIMLAAGFRGTFALEFDELRIHDLVLHDVHGQGRDHHQQQSHQQGAPTQAPAYMNYCDSSKAYYPKVTSCPEGWKFIPSR